MHIMAIADFIALIRIRSNLKELKSALVDIDEDAVPGLIAEVQALDSPTRVLALDTIASSDRIWNFGLDLCRAFFKDADVNVRLAALRASVKLGGDPDQFGRRAMRELAATDPNCDVQQAAFDALTIFYTSAASKFVQELLADAATSARVKKRAQDFLTAYERFK
jgi:hypothetical protein